MGNRGGVSTPVVVMLVALLLVAVGGFTFMMGSTGTTPQALGVAPQPVAQAASTSTTSDAVERIAKAAECSGDANPDVTVATINKERLGIGTDYNSAAVTFVNKLDKSNRFTINTNAGATRTSVSNSGLGQCGAEYRVVVLSNSSNVNGVVYELNPSTNNPFVNGAGGLQLLDLPVSNFSNLQQRVYDWDLNGFIYSNDSDGDPDNTAFQALRGTITTGSAAIADPMFNTTTENATGKVIAADENNKYRYEFQVQTISPYGRFGSRTYLAADYIGDSDANDWLEPLVKVGSFATSRSDALSNVRSTLDGDDTIALSAYEAVYDLGVALGGSGVTSIFADVDTGSGTNPDYDIVWRYLPAGIVESVKSPGTYLGVEKPRFFDDSSSRTQIASGTVNAFIISVA